MTRELSFRDAFSIKEWFTAVSCIEVLFKKMLLGGLLFNELLFNRVPFTGVLFIDVLFVQ